MKNERNRVKLWTKLEDGLVSNFSLQEFESPSGVVCIQPSVLISLELLREALWESVLHETEIVILSGTRTQEDNDRLAAKYGWVHEGGRVSVNSKHLVSWFDEKGNLCFCCAVDIYARIKRVPSWAASDFQRRVPLGDLELFARQRFDFTKIYPKTGHVHCDNRRGGRKVIPYRTKAYPT